MKENNENNVNEIRIEINDSSSTHNNNFAITLKSKNVDVDKMLPMAKQWVYGAQNKRHGKVFSALFFLKYCIC